MSSAEKQFTPEELKQYDGRDGRPVYIAYKGKVYDVTESPMWMSGDHQGMHDAGKDLTVEMGDAPHGEEMLANVKMVGTLSA